MACVPLVIWWSPLLLPAGCNVSGLYLEGADWDMENSCLVKSKPKSLVTEMPVLKVIPTEARHLTLQVRTTPHLHTCLLNFFPLSIVWTFLLLMPQNTLRTPVYTTSLRRNAMGVGLVFEADLFTTMHISHWVLQGVCLLLNADWTQHSVCDFNTVLDATNVYSWN